MSLFLKTIMKQNDKKLNVLFDIFENIDTQKKNIIENCETIVTKILRRFRT